MEARNVWVAWLALETLKAPLCGSFVLQQAPPPGRTKYEPAAGSRCSAATPRARCSCSRGLHDPLLRPLLRSPRASSSAIAPLSGTADDDTLGRDGVGKAGDKPPAASSGSSHETGGVGTATGEAAVGTDVATETRRLMSEPTIDIKLELQMRGVEHRDAFEKADLARRLAEARVSSCGNNPSPSPDDDDATTTATTTTTTAAGRDFGGAAADGPRENAHRSNKASTMMGNEPQAAAATAVATEGRGAAPDGGSNRAYARDVARGTRMGKAALARELNGMGIAHSRLSDLSVLARQYAARRQEAREDARRFPPSSARAGSSSSAEEDGEGGGEGRREGKKGSGWRRGGGEEEEEEGWGDARGQRAASGLPWRFGKEEEDEDEEDEAAGVGDADFPLGGGGRDDVGEDGRSETGWSTRANAGSAATADGGGGGDKERSRKAVLHARADRMSSRELMKALDGLGARYRIPAPRAELQQAFVSAVLAAEEDERSQADATAAAAGTRGKNIVAVSPYDTPIEEGDGGLRGTQGFGTYHSALRWARQLNFDDVLDELRYRGVEQSPRADYSYLTRLLADEVLADEELMGGEGGPEGADAYTAELEAAMSMSAQEMIRDLRAGGEIADVTLSKEALAERLAEMKLRLRGEPLPHSGSSASYYYRESPPPSQGRARGGGGGGGGSAEARGPADPLGRRDDDEDVLLELEEAAKSVGGAALLVAREAAAFVSETAAGFFPPPAADNDNDGGRSASPSAAGRAGRGAGGGGGGGAQETERSRQVRAARQRAGGVRRAATGYAQSSVNRAGFAVLQSLANGLLRGAEAAADWAGDGALAREFGRIAAQKLVLEGWKMERAKRRRATEGGGGGGSSTAAAVDGDGATGSRRDTSGYAAAPAGRRRRRPRPERETETRRPRPKGASKKKGKERGSARRTKKPARKPLWEESDDDDRGCVVM
ncbi:hypothetical protein Esi_0104_0072 [Ectocarpus siliculosus]|uniref:Uncharacterized protein n=1 Tax=Ectocarpus siliculosus TaxID=2880 RepID=D7FH23_ECTSI|nr:hypothetical protein Esi_0104_0072 [Ectocarpus siliculosus]|eukprot:CBJ28401.1 hypothetical protein Esi_0104_0072 [Ectocarpus siliculosus]